MKFRINMKMTRICFIWLFGVLCGVGLILVVGPITYGRSLDNSVHTMLQSRDPETIVPIIDKLYENETTSQFVTSMFYFNYEGIPATVEAKLCALEKIRNCEGFDLPGIIGDAMVDRNVEVRRTALAIYKEMLMKTIIGNQAILAKQLFREDNPEILDEKIRLFCLLLNFRYEETKNYFEQNGLSATVDFILDANHLLAQHFRVNMHKENTNDNVHDPND